MSPTFLNYTGFRFFIWSKEEERMHVHIEKDSNYCKCWLEPKISIENNKGFKDFELKKIIKIVKANEKEFIEKWKSHFS